MNRFFFTWEILQKLKERARYTKKNIRLGKLSFKIKNLYIYINHRENKDMSAGYIADKFGYRSVTGISVVLMALTTLSLSFLPAFSVIPATRYLTHLTRVLTRGVADLTKKILSLCYIFQNSIPKLLENIFLHK